MSSNPMPIVGIGTQFPAGTVVAILKDCVLLDTGNESVKSFTFSQIEEFVNEQLISQA